MFAYFFSSWLNPGNRRSKVALRQPGRREHSAQRRFAPRLEVLEDRAVPSGGYVFQTIDPPLAVQGSLPAGINSSGKIVGLFVDANSVTHGYLLSGGQYTTIDDPNGVGFSETFGINASGKIVGAYSDASGLFHGFLLKGGQYTTLDDPSAGTGAGQGTQAFAINASGKIIGIYTDANGVIHGFQLANGRYTTLDDPNAGTAAGRGTFAEGINASGAIVGYYNDANGLFHGFLLSGGKYTTQDDPAGVNGSEATGNNDHGQVVGGYFDANGVLHGYLLRGGKYTTLDDPAGVRGSAADAINDSGQVVGEYFDANGVFHGYLATKQDDSASGGLGAAGGSVNVLIAAAGLGKATSLGTLTVSAASNFVANSGDGLDARPIGQTAAVVTVPNPLPGSADSAGGHVYVVSAAAAAGKHPGATVDAVFANIDDFYDPIRGI
jgi:probable HAF family extracellular repeat protein